MSALDDWRRPRRSAPPKIPEPTPELVAQRRPLLYQEIGVQLRAAARDGKREALREAIALAHSTPDVDLIRGRLQRALEDA